MSSGDVRAGLPDDGARMRTFVDEVFGAFKRPEQRRWAQVYLWTLIHLSGGRTPRRAARANSLPPAAARGLHRFINASPWDWVPVRRRLAGLVAARTAPQAWTVAELIIPKRGEHSAGVHRRMDAVTGRAVNCQRALGLFLASGAGSYPVDWSLVLPGVWDSDRERRRRARIPGTEAGRTAADHVLRYAAEVAAQPRIPRLPWVLDLTGCDDAAGVLAGLARLRADVVCEVAPDQRVLAGRHTPVVTTVSALMQVPRSRQTHVVLRQGAPGGIRAVPVPAHSVAVGPAHPGNDVAGARPYRVLQRPDPDGRQPARYWLTTLADHRVEEVLQLARGHTAALSAVTVLGRRFGALDFEGRSFPGWHHHMTMASAAYVYQCLFGARDAPTAPTEPAGAPSEVLTGAGNRHETAE